jgi:hypothetical protein
MADQKGKIAVNMDSLLDGTVDALADMPEFKPFPPGVHRCQIKWEREDVTIKLKLIAQETVELADPKDTPLEAGTEVNTQFKLDNEFGQGAWKLVMASLAEIHGVKPLGELMKESDGGTYNVVTDIRKNKEKTQTYTEVKAMLAA